VLHHAAAHHRHLAEDFHVVSDDDLERTNNIGQPSQAEVFPHRGAAGLEQGAEIDRVEKLTDRDQEVLVNLVKEVEKRLGLPRREAEAHQL